MYHTLMIALDGSANAEKVLSHVEPLLASGGIKVLLFEVLPAVEPAPEKAAQAYLASIAQRLILAETLVVQGEPAAQIVDTALERLCDLVAVPTHGQTGADRWIFGAVAEKVLRSCPIPVLLVRGLGAPVVPQRVLVPLDGSPESENALPHAAAFARPLKIPCVLVHVAEPFGIEAEDSKLRGWLNRQKLQAVGRLEAGVRTLESQGLAASLLSLEGDPATEILKLSEQAPSLIAMSSHGRGGFQRWVFGSVAEKVLQGSAAPVLVVRQAGAASALKTAAHRSQ